MPRVTAFALGLCALGLFAQEASMEMPKPGPEMAKLKDMIGTFSVVESHDAGAMGPAGHSTGIFHGVAGPGGFSEVMDYRSTSSSGLMKGFRGHGMMGWDAEAKAYKQSWTDSIGPAIALSTGDWDGDKLVLSTSGTMMGKPYKEHDTYSELSAKGFRLTIEMAVGDGPYQKMMSLVYRRVVAKPANTK